MATDNTTLNLGTGGDVIVDELLADGTKAPVSKLIVGDKGMNLGPVRDGNPLPSSDATTQRLLEQVIERLDTLIAILAS